MVKISSGYIKAGFGVVLWVFAIQLDLQTDADALIFSMKKVVLRVFNDYLSLYRQYLWKLDVITPKQFQGGTFTKDTLVGSIWIIAGIYEGIPGSQRSGLMLRVRILFSYRKTRYSSATAATKIANPARAIGSV